MERQNPQKNSKLNIIENFGDALDIIGKLQ
jgi:hypothetical protein